MKVIVKAPAKINLFLDITGKRNDGYHLVEMIMQTIDLCDFIKVSDGAGKEVKISCSKNIVDAPENNTAYKATREFFSYTKLKPKGVNIDITKNIPACAGLAGGSSDAAATLLALDKLFDTELLMDELAYIGAKIGADVPFCIYGGTKLASGIGTDFSNLKDMPDCFILIVKPGIAISTKEAYALCDANKFSDGKMVKGMIEAIEDGGILDISSKLFNRFEQLLGLEEINKIKELMKNNGALNSCMTGSGSAVFGIFREKNEAEACKRKLGDYYRDIFICKPVRCGSEIIRLKT